MEKKDRRATKKERINLKKSERERNEFNETRKKK